LSEDGIVALAELAIPGALASGIEGLRWCAEITNKG